MHITFVYPPTALLQKGSISQNFNMNLGSAYIIACLQGNGFSADQFITDQPLNVRECAARILEKKPKIVGFTVYHSNYCACQLVARALRETAPGIIILFGGPTATAQAEAVLENNDFVDICVRHEGEDTCLELLSRLESANFDPGKAQLERVKGITYRMRAAAGGKSGIIRKNPGRDILSADRKIPGYLDKYPSPYLSGILKSSGLGVITARGCNQHCTYCNCSLLWKRVVSTHSVDRVIAELDVIFRQKGNGRDVDIFDDAFTLNPGRALEICDKIIENKINLPLAGVSRCDCINEELLDRMKEAGFKKIGFSLESASPHILRILGKVQPPHTKGDPDFSREKEFLDKFKRYVAYAKKIGVETVFTSIMLGLPAETLAEGQQTLDLIRSMSNHLDSYVPNIFKVLPATPIFYTHKKYGIEMIEYDNHIHYDQAPPYDTCKLEMAPKSMVEGERIRQHETIIKHLSLLFRGERNLTDVKEESYFKRLILEADVISEKLILWLRQNMALNGYFVQIYSGFDNARKYFQANKRALVAGTAPTNYLVGCYRILREDGGVTISPYQPDLCVEQVDIDINLMQTGPALACGNQDMNPTRSIAVDKEEADTHRLHRFLVELSGQQDNPLENLFNRPLYPYFSGLCRWDKCPANCLSLETAIVDAADNIKTCWHGEPVGKVGTPFHEIAENVRDLLRQTEDKRGCRDCLKKSTCAKCVFPAPITGEEYCSLKRSSDTEEAAELIRTFELYPTYLNPPGR